MDKDKVIEYAMNSPYNMNRAVLEGLLSDEESGGGSVNSTIFPIQYWNDGHNKGFIKTQDGGNTTFYTFKELEDIYNSTNDKKITIYGSYGGGVSHVVSSGIYYPSNPDWGVKAHFTFYIMSIELNSYGTLNITQEQVEIDSDDNITSTVNSSKYSPQQD